METNKPEILKEHLKSIVHINQIRDLIQQKIMERIPNFLNDIKNHLMKSAFTVDAENQYIEIIINGEMNAFEKDYIEAAYLFKSGFTRVEINTRKEENDHVVTVVRLYYQQVIKPAETMKVVQDGIKPAEIGGATLQSSKEQFMAMTQSPEDYLEEKQNV